MTQQTLAAPVAKNDMNKFIIDTKVTPIYPVRYAYANFFEEELSEASEPPTLSTLLDLDASDNSGYIKESKGYLVRLLREGWVYIREEDDAANGYFHIFKYEKIESEGQIVEQFTKYLFKNKNNAQDGLVLDDSTKVKSYPFVFVRKGIKEISIIYTAHELHPNIIDNLNSNVDERKLAMQRVDLLADSHEHAVKANADNFKKLIEDYKSRQNRFLRLKESDNPDIKDLNLDVLTTESSYELAAEQIAAKLQRKIPYGETARIIALHDPVGRQIEIAEAHAKLSIWEKNFSASNIYPYTIGSIVNDLNKTDDADMREILGESIAWDKHEKHWGEMNEQYDQFKQRQEQYSALYLDFMCGSELTVGSLSMYFQQFFWSEPLSADDTEAELNKLCSVGADMFMGIVSSAPGKAAMESIITDAADNKNNNAYSISIAVIVKLLTTPGIKWSTYTVQSVDKLFAGLGSLWGEMLSYSDYSVELSKRKINKFNAKALIYTVDEVVPHLLKVFGVKIDRHNKVRISDDALAKAFAKALSGKLNSAAKAQAEVSSNERAKSRGNRLFATSKKLKEMSSFYYSLANISVDKTVAHRYKTVIAGDITADASVTGNHKGKAVLFLDTAFSGLSAFINVQTLFDIANESKYANADPLKQAAINNSAMSLISSASSLAVDTVTLANTVTQSAAMLSKHAPQIANMSKVMIPALTARAGSVGTLLAGKLVGSAVALANFTASVAAVYSGMRAYELGHTEEATGHYISAFGSGVLFGQAAVAAGLYLTSSGAIPTPVTWAVAVVGIVAIGAGVAITMVYGKTRLELLLESCFWGTGNKHLFLDETRERDAIDKVLLKVTEINDDKLIQTSFQNEFQEFMNLFYMPKLEIKQTDNGKGAARTVKYKFSLPSFQIGQSDLRFDFFSTDWLDYVVDNKLNSDFQTTFEAYLANVGGGIYNKGNLEFEITMLVPNSSHLKWSYEWQPNITVPTRFLTEDGLIKGKTSDYGMRNDDVI
ncbi:hypothetical protein PE36_12152 [Moritella sp. PE36]|uniref:toxin VasX n=1 Tax=Moritella sp. PE36 TaxID=58051 RepID=UPI0001568B47|nr:toxin VasX [Moritella sp. PE36]EDM65984.1 hypothetical protein PE36_12152 [Moritella sp. PE36]